jgi:hypothetical protein
MKPQITPQSQDDQQWQAMLAADEADFTARLAADPAYAPWSDDQHAADAMTFDEWLDTEEGRAWLNDEAEKDRFQRHGFHDLESWDFAAAEGH